MRRLLTRYYYVIVTCKVFETNEGNKNWPFVILLKWIRFFFYHLYLSVTKWLTATIIPRVFLLSLSFPYSECYLHIASIQGRTPWTLVVILIITTQSLFTCQSQHKKHQNNVWHLFKVNNNDTRVHYWRRSGVLIAKFEQI